MLFDEGYLFSKSGQDYVAKHFHQLEQCIDLDDIIYTVKSLSIRTALVGTDEPDCQFQVNHFNLLC